MFVREDHLDSLQFYNFLLLHCQKRKKRSPGKVGGPWMDPNSFGGLKTFPFHYVLAFLYVTDSTDSLGITFDWGQ